MELTAKSGKVIWSSNTVVTLTSGSSYTSPTTGYMSNGHGYVSGGGGGGSVSTTQKNVEKARIALFDGGERNVEIDTDPLFSPGNIATVVSANGQRVAYYNRTTSRWFHHEFPLPFKQRMTVLAIWIVVAYLAFKAVFGGFAYINEYNDLDFGVTWTAISYSAAAIAVAVLVKRFARMKRAEVEDAAFRLVREQDNRYEKEIAQSQEAWRKMLAEL